MAGSERMTAVREKVSGNCVGRGVGCDEYVSMRVGVFRLEQNKNALVGPPLSLANKTQVKSDIRLSPPKTFTFSTTRRNQA